MFDRQFCAKVFCEAFLGCLDDFDQHVVVEALNGIFDVLSGPECNAFMMQCGMMQRLPQMIPHLKQQVRAAVC